MDALKLSHYKPSTYSALYGSILVGTAAIIGLQPSFLSLQTLGVFALLFLFKMTLVPFFILSAVFWVLGAFFFDGLNHTIGSALLRREELEPMWAQLSDLPIVPLTRFNNTVFMGSMVSALTLAVLCFVILYMMHKREV